MPGRRLDQVDAIRPVKQAGVVSTHVLLVFAPASATVTAGAAVLLLHVSRETFFFVSACMLTYAYADLDRAGLGRFYWRRFVSVGIPYLCWTLIYFLYLLPASHYQSPAAAFLHLGYLVETGYYQLYFLLVIMQFYLAFPLVLMLLRRTRGHHGLVLACAAAFQVMVGIFINWKLVPSPVFADWQQRVITSYVLYLVGGSVVAFHLPDVHRWVCAHARLVIGYTAVTGLGVLGVYYLGQYGIMTALGTGNDPFQPSVLPFNIGAIACAYLAGVALVRPSRSRRALAMVRSGSDNSYGIYLSQMIFITALAWLGWERLTSTVPWPLLCLVTAAGVYLASGAATALIARTPLAVPLTGRKRQPRRPPLPPSPRPAPQAAVLAPASTLAPASAPATPTRLPDMSGMQVMFRAR